ncbi:hypothetical protein GTQ40_08155 [Flavobacteriaceae bacterium R38]|nr:hypothetical protein [Flavobacteriaceae bacterium R38]
MKQNNIWLFLIGFLFAFITLKNCERKSIDKNPIVTVVSDTIWQTKVDTFKVQTVKYKTVYVDKEHPQIVLKTDEVNDINSENIEEARVYQDTIQNDDIEIYTYNLLKGELLDSKLSYKLKVPREIITTKTIEYPKTYKSGLYVFGELGGNKEHFNNTSLGLQYHRKGNWFVSYRVNLNDPVGITHNVGVGLKLF